jgi:hypothetical protein
MKQLFDRVAATSLRAAERVAKLKKAAELKCTGPSV